MIRVYKDSNVPSSLTTTTAYDGEDVKKQLLADQHDKCYLCERNRDTDFEIEHHRSEHNYPKLRQNWDNLFMGCRYCNGKKSDSFDNTLNPKNVNIEEEIEQRIDFLNKQALFVSVVNDDQHNETISLLNRLYNGTNKTRKLKEERFIEQTIGNVNRFLGLIVEYKNNPIPENEKAIRDELSIEKECLGFKYWIIKDDSVLLQVFANDIIWNKTA